MPFIQCRAPTRSLRLPAVSLGYRPDQAAEKDCLHGIRARTANVYPVYARSFDDPHQTAPGLSAAQAAVICAAQGGDADAFAELFRIFRPRIFRIARQYFVPGWERDDLLQEGTIGFYKAIRDYKNGLGSFSAFVDLCVRRQVITFIKTATRQKHALLNHALSLDAPAFADSDALRVACLRGHDGASPRHHEDSVEFLNALWHRCSELERGVLSMYSNDYSFLEMAWELGVKLKAIDSAVWRVKTKARKLLAERPSLLPVKVEVREHIRIKKTHAAESP